MFFCTGPPRTYASSPSAVSANKQQAGERFEDVALAAHPQLRVWARVTSRKAELWAATPHPLPLPAARGRRLASVRRAGRAVDALRAAAAEGSVATGESSSSSSGWEDAALDDAKQLPRVHALWVADDRLAVVESGAQTVEFYAFEGLAELEAAADGASGGGGAASSATLKGSFLEEFALNQGDSVGDVAASLGGVAGGKYLFVGMASGLICVVEVAPLNDASSWFGEPQRTRMWKIDVLPHLATKKEEDVEGEEDSAGAPAPSCYALACASSDPAAAIATLYLVACFEGGKCFIMHISPAAKAIDQLLSLVNTERDASAACFGRCTAVALSATGARLALGWSDGGVSLFRLAMRAAPAAAPVASDAPIPPSPSATATLLALTLEPIRELSLAPWGYATEDVGSVSALAWTLDARAVAVGYELRGFSLFSLDGCRLMSSLPQHQQPRPEATDDSAAKEACAHGVLQLLWTRESSSLIVAPRGEQYEQLVSPPASPRSRRDSDDMTTTIAVEDLVERVAVELLKEEDGLCLSLSGAPGRCGAWVRSDNSFTRRARDGGVGPAEASGRIRGGDLLVAINDNDEVERLPFEQVVGALKTLPTNARVTLHFLRLNWSRLVPLATQALTSEEFLNAYNVQLLDDEDLCVREYALRMQVLHGDCDLEARPPLLDFEQRAKFDGWEAMQGVSTESAQHRYVKLLFALFPVWNPLRTLQAVSDFGSAVLTQQQHTLRKQRLLERAQLRQPMAMRRRSAASFCEFDFARSVPLSGGRTSRLALLERAKVRLVSAPSLDDPSALTSCVSWSVPAEFEAKCAPLRLVAVSASGNQVAVAGQRGFCLLNLLTGKWRMFGNVNDEQDMVVHSLLWIKEDAIVVCFTRFTEDHKLMHLQAYPRNHLDADSILAKLSYPSVRAESVPSGDAGAKGGGSSGVAPGSSSGSKAVVQFTGDCFYTMESSEGESHIFCLSMRELWSFGVEVTGSVKQNDLALTLELRRSVKLPSRIAESCSLHGRSSPLTDFAVIPRFLHVQDEKLREAQQQKLQQEREREQQENSGGGWLSSLISIIAGGEVPNQYKPEEVLPRFAFVDDVGDVVVWDPEQRSLRLLCSNVSTLSRLFVSASASPSWPTQCRLMFGLYGPEGMRLWLPLLDGVYLTHTQAFEQDPFRLETFLACHDPLRAKTYEIEFGTAPAPAELYEQVAAEYGIVLEKFVGGAKSSPSRKQQLPEGVANLRGCLASVDDVAAKDRMLRFDSDVKVLGVQQAFGLLVGLSQDVYVPSGVFQPCYDVFARVQPFFHTLLCFLVQNQQLAWATAIVHAVRGQFALSTPTQELFLHSMLEACFRRECSAETFRSAIELLQPATGASASDRAGDLDEYCEIVAHVARKSEPSRLKLLFPAAGDPLELLAICRQRSELRTAANFLLVLEESSPTAPPAFRKACAAELLAQCIDHDEWDLAQHVVRVARDWEHPGELAADESSSIDAQLAELVWKDFVRGEYERVVWSVAELQAKLPPARAAAVEMHNAQEEAIVSQRLHEVFVASNQLRQLRCVVVVVAVAVAGAEVDSSGMNGGRLTTDRIFCLVSFVCRILLQAVTEARYESWIRVVKRVLSTK